jgi:diketogulonate reductase-like aldo/keto reductase
VLLRWAQHQGVVPVFKSARPDRVRSNIALGFTLTASHLAALAAVGPDAGATCDGALAAVAPEAEGCGGGLSTSGPRAYDL